MTNLLFGLLYPLPESCCDVMQIFGILAQLTGEMDGDDQQGTSGNWAIFLY